MLNRIGIATPQPIALTLTKMFPLFWLGSVFFEPVEGKDLREFFNTPSLTEEEKYHIAAALEDAFARMHAMGITAGRIDPERVIVSDRNIIFLNPATFRRSVLSMRCKQSRMAGRFLASCRDIPELRGLLTEHFKNRSLI
jgi:tRNA A-37 threonylcarbamoyl transferase component Bud32